MLAQTLIFYTGVEHNLSDNFIYLHILCSTRISDFDITLNMFIMLVIMLHVACYISFVKKINAVNVNIFAPYLGGQKYCLSEYVD